jgi:hypothetical protein
MADVVAVQSGGAAMSAPFLFRRTAGEHELRSRTPQKEMAGTSPAIFNSQRMNRRRYRFNSALPYSPVGLTSRISSMMANGAT